ncbi:MAG: DUF5117 domain-containing protein, partial [Longimicrobiales bacterium]
MTRFARVAIAILLVLSGRLAVAAQEREYDEVVPDSAETDEGLFDVHRVGERLLFEIPDSLLGRDMVVMSRFHRTQADFADVGALMAPNLVVRWERRGDRVLLRATSHAATADEGSAVGLAVENGSFSPVLAALEIAARGDDASVVDVTDLYLDDTPAFTMPQNQRSSENVRDYDRDRSWLEWSRSFPINVEVRVAQTYDADAPPSAGRGGALS